MRCAAAGRPPAPGSMGGGFELLQFAVSSGLGLGGLVLSVLQWRAALRRPATVTISGGGVEVRLDAPAAADEATVRRIVGLLRAQETAVPGTRAPDGDRLAGNERARGDDDTR
ncbi:hypothetical protein ABT084_13535 [Streptomyces sp. NPDC002138]|uniref:effector-associated constant component EACC1 n=1 Tax=Streptomyces sp. NPDC002138 TaxID=3154410 RepID=UPI0033301F54